MEEKQISIDDFKILDYEQALKYIETKTLLEKQVFKCSTKTAIYIHQRDYEKSKENLPSIIQMDEDNEELILSHNL